MKAEHPDVLQRRNKNASFLLETSFLVHLLLALSTSSHKFFNDLIRYWAFLGAVANCFIFAHYRVS